MFAKKSNIITDLNHMNQIQSICMDMNTKDKNYLSESIPLNTKNLRRIENHSFIDDKEIFSDKENNTTFMAYKKHNTRDSMVSGSSAMHSNIAFRNLSEVATAALMTKKLMDSNSSLPSSMTRRNAANLTDGKLVAMYHQQRKEELKKKYYSR